jgi:hypothetical protein
MAGKSKTRAAGLNPETAGDILKPISYGKELAESFFRQYGSFSDWHGTSVETDDLISGNHRNHI